MAILDDSAPKVVIGIASEDGRRPRNEDFAGASLGPSSRRASQGLVAALADGMGGAKGGREAAEIAVRGFLDGYHEQPETLDVRRTAGRLIDSLNSWISAQGRTDPCLEGMGCTFTALVLKGRSVHVLHVGDSRAYRFSDQGLARLTEDHCLKRPNLDHVLFRALGIEDSVKLDYARHPVSLHDRYLLCSDGVHGCLSPDAMAAILAQRASPEETARGLTAAALAKGGEDNATALVIDVIGLPPPDRGSLGQAILPLPIREMPKSHSRIDGFRLGDVLADGRYSRLFRAIDENTGAPVVLKFPKPRVAGDNIYRSAFLREAWVASRIVSPWVGGVLELAEGRQTRLYTVMPLHKGETLEKRLARRPPLSLEEGRRLGAGLGRAVAALHRAGVVHRDIKPDNVMLDPEGGLKLIDLGVVRVPGMEDFPPEEIPGTPSYMAPELLDGAAGDELSDQFALGVTLFKALTGAYPYGEVEPFSHPRFGKPACLTALRPDLPAWLEATLNRAIDPDRTRRHADVMELVLELENGPGHADFGALRRKPLIERHPIAFWQVVAALLALALGVVLARR